MMEATPRWTLPLLFAGQAQKEMFHNEALALIDLLLHGRAESADRADPPVDPQPGACWIVPPGATGAWAGQEGRVAGWTEGGWRFVPPRAGLRLWVADRGHAMTHDGTIWQDEMLHRDGLYIDGVRVVAAREPAVPPPDGGTVVDLQARTAIGHLISAMRAHGLIAP